MAVTVDLNKKRIKLAYTLTNVKLLVFIHYTTEKVFS